MKRTAILAVALVATSATALTAQSQRRPRAAHMSRPGVEMAGGRGNAAMARYQPALLLRMQERLELTEQQVGQLAELNTEALAAQEQTRARLTSQRAQLMEALVAEDPNPQTVRRHHEAAQAALSDLQWSRINATLEARALLTDDQVTVLREARPNRGARDRRGPRRGR